MCLLSSGHDPRLKKEHEYRDLPQTFQEVRIAKFQAKKTAAQVKMSDFEETHWQNDMPVMSNAESEKQILTRVQGVSHYPDSRRLFYLSGPYSNKWKCVI